MLYVLAIIFGLVIGVALILGLFLYLNRRHEPSKKETKSITKWLFVTTQVCALIWVFTSYAIAIYSMIVLGQVYTLSEIFDPAINTILGIVAIKQAGNIFEHNDGGIFGESNSKEDDYD